MKHCMSHYIHKTIPDANFKADSSSSFGDMTSQNFPREKRTSHQIRLFTPQKTGLTLKKWVFMSKIILLDPKLTSMSISAIFKQRKGFSFSKFLGCLNEKRATATPWLTSFAKIWSERVLRIKTKSYQVWPS